MIRFEYEITSFKDHFLNHLCIKDSKEVKKICNRKTVVIISFIKRFLEILFKIYEQTLDLPSIRKHKISIDGFCTV